MFHMVAEDLGRTGWAWLERADETLEWEIEERLAAEWIMDWIDQTRSSEMPQMPRTDCREEDPDRAALVVPSLRTGRPKKVTGCILCGLPAHGPYCQAHKWAAG